MKKTLILVTAALATAISAEELPILTEKPFLGAWIGYETRDFDFVIDGEGKGELFPKKNVDGDNVRASAFHTIEFEYSLQEKVGDRWVNRTLEKDGFETDIEASVEIENVEFIATFKGGTKAKINHIFDGKEILSRISQVSTESKNELRLGIKVGFPDLYRLRNKAKMEEDEIEEKMEGDEIRATRIDKKRFKFDVFEKVDLNDEKILGKGALDYSLESKQLGDRKAIISSARGSKGTILFEQGKALDLHVPIAAIWYPETPESTMVFELK